MGAALYRAKKYNAALEKFNEASESGYKLVAWDLVFRAMTLHRLDREAEAKQSLLDALQLSSQVTSWHEGVEVECLIREAEALLEVARETTTSNE